MRILSLVLLLQSAVFCIAADINNLIVFGDSYSDVGNAVRYSNGPLWDEYLALGWESSLYSFAFAGAVCDNAMFPQSSDTPSMKDQIEMYYNEKLQLESSDTVYVFWIGINDITYALQTDTPEDYLPLIVECISSQIRNIRKIFHANRLIVPNIPPLELMPVHSQSDKASLKDATDTVNRLLAREIKNLNQHHSALELDLLDVNTLIYDMVAKPSDFGMADTKEPYWKACEGHCEEDVDTFIWWDKGHFTSGVHRILANALLMSGSFVPSTVVDETSTQAQEIIRGNPKYQSPKYKPKANTGLIDQVISNIAMENESKMQQAQNNNKASTVDGEDQESWPIFLFGVMITVLVFVMVLAFVRRKKASSGLASLSGLARTARRNNNSRGRFMPLSHVNTSV